MQLCSLLQRLWRGLLLPMGSVRHQLLPLMPFRHFHIKAEILGYCAANPSGRQWPERTVCGSHPSGCSNMDNGDNDEFFEIYEKMKSGDSSRRLAGADENEMMYGAAGGTTHLSQDKSLVYNAPMRHVYDARLVSGLYDFEKQGASLAKVTLFTTRITQLKIVGVNPDGSDYQHFGLTLELSQPVTFNDEPVRFITLEMMAQGLMWTLSENAPSTGYDYVKKSTMTYDDLSLKYVARYLAEQQGRTYVVGVTDCQTLAAELAMRLSLHGRRLASANSGMRTVHAYVMWPTSVSIRELKHKIYELVAAEERAVELQLVQDVATCPTKLPHVQMMSAEAQAAWQACTGELSLTQVSFTTASSNFQELITALEILGDLEAVRGSHGFYLGRPAVSQSELLHGPTHAEYKNLHSNTFDGRFPIVCFVGSVLLLVLIKAVQTAYRRWGRGFTRSPWCVPLVFLISIFSSGTVAVPVAASSWAYRQKKQWAAEEGPIEEENVELVKEGAE